MLSSDHLVKSYHHTGHGYPITRFEYHEDLVHSNVITVITYTLCFCLFITQRVACKKINHVRDIKGIKYCNLSNVILFSVILIARFYTFKLGLLE